MSVMRSAVEHGIYVSNSGDISMGGDGIISGALVEANVIWDNGAGAELEESVE